MTEVETRMVEWFAFTSELLQDLRFSDDPRLAEYVRALIGTLDRHLESRAYEQTDPSGGRRSRIDLGPPPTSTGSLTDRELSVLRRLAQGHSVTVIARELGCAARTIDKHLEHSYRKLGVSDRVNAIRVAAAAGMLRTRAEAEDGRRPALGSARNTRPADPPLIVWSMSGSSAQPLPAGEPR